MKIKNVFAGLTVFFLFAATVSFSSEKPKVTAPEIPENVKAIINKSCFGCHNTDSNNEDAKEELDFKKFDTLSTLKQISTYKHIGETVEENKMPPKKFLDKRPDKKLTNEEKEVLIAWAKKEAERLVNAKR